MTSKAVPSKSASKTGPKGGPTPKRNQASAPGTGGQDWKRLPDGSRSVQSVWVWRGFLFAALVFAGIGISLKSEGNNLFAVLWWVIAAGWFATSMWLWRKHIKDDNAAYAASRKAGRKSR